MVACYMTLQLASGRAKTCRNRPQGQFNPRQCQAERCTNRKTPGLRRLEGEKDTNDLCNMTSNTKPVPEKEKTENRQKKNHRGCCKQSHLICLLSQPFANLPIATPRDCSKRLRARFVLSFFIRGMLLSTASGTSFETCQPCHCQVLS